MALYKRGGVWWYEFVFSGRRTRRSAHTGNRRAAGEVEAAAKLALARGEAGIERRRPAPTLAEFLPRVLEHLATLHADRPRTVRFYAQQARYLLRHPKLGGWRLDQVNGERVSEFARWRRSSVSVVATNHGLRTLRRALRLAVEWGELGTAPQVRALAGERRRDAVLPRELEAVYLDRLRPEVRAMAELMLATGLRPGEAAALEWRDVDFSGRGSLRVRAEVAKSHRERVVPLTARARAVLETQPRLGDRVIGVRLLVAQRDHARARRECGISGLTLHGLRHTAATRMGEAGLDAFALQTILGHASITTTQRYVHPQAAALEQAAATLDTAARKVPTISPTAPGAAAASRRK